MATKFLTDIDLQGFIDLNENQIRNAVVHPLSTPPSSPTIGQIYYDNEDEKVYVYTGVTNGWVPIGGAGTSANNATITLTAGTGLSGGESFTTDQSANEEITFSIDYAGTDNIIDAATNLEGTAIATGDSIIYHDAGDNNVKKGFVSDLPFNNYSHPTFNGDDISVDTSGVNVIDTLTVTTNTDGHVTAASAATRTLPNATTSAAGVMSSTDKSKLDNIEANATADQTDAEIETAYNNQVAQVSAAERTAGTETGIRRYAPADVKSMIDQHAVATDEDVSVANLQTRLGEISSNTTIGDAADVEITFAGDATIQGDLTVSGTTTTVDTTNLAVTDALIELNSGLTAGNTNDAGIIIERGTTGNNAAMIWDESSDRFVFGTTTATGTSTGFLTVIDAVIQASKLYGDLNGNVTGDVTGNVTGSADTLSTARTISLTGDVTGSTTFDGSANASITASIAANSVALGTDTTGNYVASISTSGALNGSSSSEGGAATLSVDSASTTQVGVVELATNTETTTGTDTTRATTPAGVKAAIDGRTATATITDDATVTHNLGSQDVIVQMYDATNLDTIFADVVRTNTNQITISFSVTPTNSVKVLIIKM